MATLIISSDVNQLPFVNAFIKEYMPQELMGKLQQIELVTEELLVNIFRYAYYTQKGQIEISCQVTKHDNESFFCISIRDWGHHFDPFQTPTPNLDLSISERPIGGLGIHLVRTLVNEYKYKRVDGSNVVELFFAILPI